MVCVVSPTAIKKEVKKLFILFDSIRYAQQCSVTHVQFMIKITEVMNFSLSEKPCTFID